MRRWSPGDMVTERVRLARPLADGGMGAVWIADHLTLEKQIAVKFMADRVLADPALRERFAREARAAARIQNPHVVQIMDFGATMEGDLFMLMELCDGESLRQRLERLRRLPATEVVRIVRQLASALDAAHAAGVLHRDIKPDNLVLSVGRDGFHLKVLDFGIAKLPRGSIPTGLTAGAAIGTLPYMSPEQLFTPASVDARSDAWSAAVVAHEALSGELPFSVAAVDDFVKSLETCAYTPSAALPPGAKPIFQRAFARDREQRFQSAGELAVALERADLRTALGPPSASSSHAFLPTEAVNLTTTARAPAPRAVIAGSIAAALAIGVALTLFAWPKSTRTPSRDDDDDKRHAAPRDRSEEVCAHLMTFVDDGKFGLEECRRDIAKMKAECSSENLDTAYDCLLRTHREDQLRPCTRVCKKR